MNNNDISLTGSEFEAFSDALIAAYPTPDDLEILFEHKLGMNLWNVAPSRSPMRHIAFAVLRSAKAQGWTVTLLQAMVDDSPGNAKVRALANRYGFSIVEETNPAHVSDRSPAFERIVRKSSRFVDAPSFSRRMAEVERQVCRVEIGVAGGHVIKGTGFLVGPSAILTNYHVMEPVVRGEQGEKTSTGLVGKPSDVIVRFDYKRTTDGLEIDPGVLYHLADDWLIDASLESKIDTMVDSGGGLPAEDELDYVVVRLESDAGNHAIGQKSAPDTSQVAAPIRGWISLPKDMPDIESDRTVLIMQHPFGSTLKLALGTDAIIGLNDNCTRLRYATNTEQGSSGSPVFNINWELIALHHLGDPNFERPAKYNQGIPANAIRALLGKRNRLIKLE